MSRQAQIPPVDLSLTSRCLLGSLAMVGLIWGAIQTQAIVHPTEEVAGKNSDPNDRRLDAIGAFSFTHWLNGEAQGDNWWGSAVLIAPQLIVTVRHNLSGVTNTDLVKPNSYCVRFRRNPEGSLQYLSTNHGSSVSYPFYARIRKWLPAPGRQDLAIGILDKPVTHISPLQVEMRPPEAGREIVLAAWGSYSHQQGASSPRDGLRDSGQSPCKKLSGVVPGYLRWPNSFQPLTSPVVNMHDSGGGVLAVSGTNLTYLGAISGFGIAASVCQFNKTPFGDYLQGKVRTVTFRTDGTAGATLSGWESQVVAETETNVCETVAAITPEGWAFEKWTVDSREYSTNNPITVSNVAHSLTLTANFSRRAAH